MWSSLLLLSSLLVVNVSGTAPNAFLLFTVSTNEFCVGVPVINLWMDFAIANSSCTTYNSSTVANAPQFYPLPFHIAENDSVTLHWIDLFPFDFCMTSVNASIEYRMFNESVPFCPEKYDGYVLSSPETILNQTIMFSPLNSSVCDERVISIPSSCGGRLTSLATSFSTAASSNAVVVVHSSANLHFTVFETSSLNLQTSSVHIQTSALNSTAVSTVILSSSAHFTAFQTSSAHSTAVSTVILSSSAHFTAFQTSSVHSTVVSTAIHSSFQSSSFHSTAIHSSTSFATTIMPTSTPQNNYCSPRTDVNERGQFDWPLTLAGMTVTILCPSGPIGATASRLCSTSSDWESPDVMRCATTDVTNGFIELSKVNITIFNTDLVSENMSILVENASINFADQNKNNILIIANVIEDIANVFMSQIQIATQSLFNKTVNSIIQTNDLIEEWPFEVLELSSNDIIQSFDEFVRIGINLENYTSSISVTAEDIVFRVESFERSNFNRLTISGFAFNNTLNFNMQDSSSNLTNREVARVVIPLSILNVTNSENIDIAATLYKKANFFPVREEVNSSSSIMTVVGSAVISIIVGGIPDGTELIDPVTIILALNEENVTNPHCAFWNFTGADGIGNWSIDGCTTVVDPNDLSNVTCYCNHLTNFAILVDISTRTGNGTSPPPFGVRVGLEVITYVGVCLSLVGLILTILTLLVF
uniref:GPS domain-containing protein n=1 Tax=Amphimedon queenslandica TaxID=400682 RepID=A0A1X7TQ04_AMPQE